MIETPTVLVLGAGASMPYGFPSGRELFFLIKRNLQTQSRDPNNTFLWGKLLSLGISSKQILSFRTALTYADPPSVDAFLEHRDEFMDVGKLAMALSLIPYENEQRLFNAVSSTDMPTSWYRYLMDRLATNDAAVFRLNRLSVITFNYDRSLEHYLFTALKYRYRKNDTECADLLSAIPILHVHGSLGSLPWQGGHVIRPYKNTDDSEEIRLASNNIRVMSEKDDHASIFRDAISLLEQASKVYFLGFGYHPTNLRRLGISTLINKPEKFGTSLGLGAAAGRAISKSWGIVFKGADIDIWDLFRDHCPLQTNLDI